MSQLIACFTYALGSACLGAAIAATSPALAQPSPDMTLNGENSDVSAGFDAQGNPVYLIEGGAQRGGNLFHSFSEFNITENQQVYFASPVNVDSLLVRVTGDTPSTIAGTLGVNGLADLFLINPNGIALSETAQLDIPGSFYVTTADAIALGTTGLYSATNPAQSQLLAVDPSTRFYDYLNQDSAGISSEAALTVGGNLILAGGRLDLFDDITTGGSLLLVGQPIETENANYVSGGRLDIRHTDGARGRLGSRGSAVLRAGGDVTFARYWGGSLQILSGGRVQGDFIGVNNVVPNGDNNPTETIMLSRTLPEEATPREVTFTPDAYPTVDIRAGLTPEALGLLTVDEGSRTSADIVLRTVRLRPSNGVLLLSTQFSPDTNLPGGNINIINVEGEGNQGTPRGPGSDLFFDSRADVDIRGLIETTSGNTPGEVNILADGQTVVTGNGQPAEETGIWVNHAGTAGTADILIRTGSLLVRDGAQITVNSTGRADGGRIVIEADDDVILERSPGKKNESTGIANFINRFRNRPSDYRDVNSGGIQVTAQNIIMRGGAQIQSRVNDRGWGNSGDVILRARESILMERGPRTEGSRSLATPSIISSIENFSRGQAGNISMFAPTITVVSGGIQSNTRGTGDGGDVQLTADSQILLGGVILTRVNPQSFFFNSNEISESGGTGNAGNVELTAPEILLVDGGSVRSNTEYRGNAGNVRLNASERVEIRGVCQNSDCVSGITTQVSPTAEKGNGGQIVITSPLLAITDQGFLDASTANRMLPRAGLTLAGDTPSQAGEITVNVNELLMDGNATMRTSTLGDGDAGRLNVMVSGNATIRNNSRIASNATDDATGQSGNVSVGVQGFLLIQDQSEISASNNGTGIGGTVNVVADNLTLRNASEISAFTDSNTGGNIFISVPGLLLLRNGSGISATAGLAQETGDGGNINITARYIVALPSENSDISANAFSGAGGQVAIATQGLFGIEPREALTPFSDITASSERGVSGVVSLNSLDTSFIENNVAELPDAPLDTDSVVANSCIVANQAPDLSLHVVSGTVPTSPNGGQTNYSLGRVQTVSAAPQNDAVRAYTASSPASLSNAGTVIEPDAVYQLADGRLVISQTCQQVK